MRARLHSRPRLQIYATRMCGLRAAGLQKLQGANNNNNNNNNRLLFKFIIVILIARPLIASSTPLCQNKRIIFSPFFCADELSVSQWHEHYCEVTVDVILMQADLVTKRWSFKFIVSVITAICPVWWHYFFKCNHGDRIFCLHTKKLQYTAFVSLSGLETHISRSLVCFHSFLSELNDLREK
jgi:hypothetical protein